MNTPLILITSQYVVSRVQVKSHFSIVALSLFLLDDVRSNSLMHLNIQKSRNYSPVDQLVHFFLVFFIRSCSSPPKYIIDVYEGVVMSFSSMYSYIISSLVLLDCLFNSSSGKRPLFQQCSFSLNLIRLFKIQLFSLSKQLFVFYFVL